MGQVRHFAEFRCLAFVIQAFEHFKHGTCEPNQLQLATKLEILVI